MRAAIKIFIILCLCALTGCSHEAGTTGTANSNKETELLTIDFSESQTLRYKFISSRQTTINWEPSKTATTQEQPTVSEYSESMKMVVAYTPVEINLYGLTTVKATIESVQITRSDGPQQDAVEHLAGKTFTFKVGPTGKIEDNTELDQLIKATGEKAFRPDSSRGRIKEPDMIGDFVASQWFLWDSVSSIANTSQGVGIGQTWQSKLSVPTPMVMRQARDVTYSLKEIRPGENGRIAVISSSFSKADSAPQSWPVPYTGRFQMSGTFGFLGNYNLTDLQGSGEELFNITLGRTEQYSQQYRMQMQASIPLGIGENPDITISQNLTMALIED